MAESKEEVKSLLMKSERREKEVRLKLSIQKTKIMTFSLITSWKIDGNKMETVIDLIFMGSKITSDADCKHEIKGPFSLEENL